MNVNEKCWEFSWWFSELLNIVEKPPLNECVHLCWIYIRVCDMSKTNVAVFATNCSFTLSRRYYRRLVGNLSTTNFWKPSGVGFGCVADNVFNYY